MMYNPETSRYSYTDGLITIDVTEGGDLRLLVGGEGLRAPLPKDPAERFRMACAVAAGTNALMDVEEDR